MNKHTFVYPQNWQRFECKKKQKKKPQENVNKRELKAREKSVEKKASALKNH